MVNAIFSFVRRLGRIRLAEQSAPHLRDAAPPVVSKEVYEIRDRIASRFLRPGWRGIEIGAGIHPQRLSDDIECIYVDKRDATGLRSHFGAGIEYRIQSIETVPELFPEGVDFLIAHNVLEHSHDPIGTLITWCGWIRDGGIGILSIPDKAYVPQDALRPSPDAFHLLSDFLLDRGEDAFESREHIPGFLAGWHENIQPDLTKSEYCEHCLREMHRGDHDLHWHALDRDACDFILGSASLFGGRRIEMLTVCTPSEGAFRTLGEIVFVFRMLPGPAFEDSVDESPIAVASIDALRESMRIYRAAVNKLEKVLDDLAGESP